VRRRSGVVVVALALVSSLFPADGVAVEDPGVAFVADAEDDSVPDLASELESESEIEVDSDPDVGPPTMEDLPADASDEAIAMVEAAQSGERVECVGDERRRRW